MCVVSMVGDHYGDKWLPNWPATYPEPERPWHGPVGPTYAEFNKLKEEVAELVALLKRAKKYDADNNEPDCEVADKMAFLRKIAKSVGVDLDAALASQQ